MTRDEVTKLVENVPTGTTLRLTYKREDVDDVAYLWGMINSGVISATDLETMVIMAIARSGNWGNDQNRCIEVTTTEKFSLKWFLDRVAGPLESLDVIQPAETGTN